MRSWNGKGRPIGRHRDHLAVQDQGARPEVPPDDSHDVGQAVGDLGKATAPDADLRAHLVDLDPGPVVLHLQGRAPAVSRQGLGDPRGGIGQHRSQGGHQLDAGRLEPGRRPPAPPARRPARGRSGTGAPAAPGPGRGRGPPRRRRAPGLRGTPGASPRRGGGPGTPARRGQRDPGERSARRACGPGTPGRRRPPPPRSRRPRRGGSAGTPRPRGAARRGSPAGPPRSPPAPGGRRPGTAGRSGRPRPRPPRPAPGGGEGQPRPRPWPAGYGWPGGPGPVADSSASRVGPEDGVEAHVVIVQAPR